MSRVSNVRTFHSQYHRCNQDHGRSCQVGEVLHPRHFVLSILTLDVFDVSSKLASKFVVSV